jgi:hypothetical protein
MPRQNETHAAFVARWSAARGFTKKDVRRRQFWRLVRVWRENAAQHTRRLAFRRRLLRMYLNWRLRRWRERDRWGRHRGTRRQRRTTLTRRIQALRRHLRGRPASGRLSGWIR